MLKTNAMNCFRKGRENEMNISIKLFAGFRQNRFKMEEREIPENSTIIDVLNQLGINEPELGVAMIDGRHVTTDHVLQTGVTISLFPKVGGG